ncbi:MAG: glycosyltransferase family 2 protein [Bacteroidales bacterium]|nr:glycosyltransferase family 2 protein [Bacteroidales bacterium]
MNPNVLFKSQTEDPVLSIILLDWSCRESFHALDYLNNQSVMRDQYEVILVEYYSRIAPQIKKGLKECSDNNKPPLIDQWIIMNMPENIYYHKHLMYNAGILASRGKIVCICDSDAIFPPNFVETVLQVFFTNSDIVLHFDEICNDSRRFYPFNYPSIKQIVGEGCVNYVNGKSRGILTNEDIIHQRNYGACMCALRKDIIDIGGADEHIDYLGHICGPYDLTFRLINAGKREIWHEDVYIYHVWHPGNTGKGNHLGPHDGMNMSTPALKSRETGRILPLDENPAIKVARLGWLSYTIREEKVKNWIIE